MPSHPRRLSLRRETLRQLHDGGLSQAAGAASVQGSCQTMCGYCTVLRTDVTCNVVCAETTRIETRLCLITNLHCNTGAACVSNYDPPICH